MTTAEPRRVGRPPGPRRDPQERREDLLDAAVRAIRARGADLSMAELAAEAGVTRPILYDHFGDRAGVARALADRYISELEVTLLRAFNQAVPLRVAFAQGVDAFCEFVENDADLYRFLQTAAAPAGPIDSAIGTGLAATIAGALRAAGADETSAPTWGFAVLGMVFAAAEWWSVTRTISRSALVEQVTSLIADGLTGAAIADVLGPFLP